MAKMDWYIEQLINGQRPFEIAATGKHYGTICYPTGTGKSAVIFDDMFDKILHHKKVIINLVAPILRLKNQTVMDFISIISDPKVKTYFKAKKIDISKISFYNNSSSSEGYGDDFDAKSIDQLSSEKNNIIIIDSCLDSFPKAITALEKRDLKSTYVTTYIDESHRLTLIRVEDENSDKVFVDIKKLEKVSDCIYAVSATPHTDLTDRLNKIENPKYNEKDRNVLNKFVLYMSPFDGIKKGLIVEPSMFILTQTDGNTGALDVNTCIHAMNQSKTIRPNIYHKILINCRDIKQIDELENRLINLNYRVFKTHSKNSDDKITKKVDSYEGDCFVLHCRQLIAGIDINSLTDCIIPTFGYESFYKENIIQTIGRCMRSAEGERGELDLSKRTKPDCNIFFVANNEDKDSAYKMAYGLLLEYYRIGKIEFAAVGVENLARGDMEEIENDKEQKPLRDGIFNGLHKLTEAPQQELYDVYYQIKYGGYNFSETTAAKMLVSIYEGEIKKIENDSLNSMFVNKDLAEGNLLVQNLLLVKPENAEENDWNEMVSLIKKYA